MKDWSYTPFLPPCTLRVQSPKITLWHVEAVRVKYDGHNQLQLNIYAAINADVRVWSIYDWIRNQVTGVENIVQTLRTKF